MKGGGWSWTFEQLKWLGQVGAVPGWSWTLKGSHDRPRFSFLYPSDAVSLLLLLLNQCTEAATAQQHLPMLRLRQRGDATATFAAVLVDAVATHAAVVAAAAASAVAEMNEKGIHLSCKKSAQLPDPVDPA